MVEVWYGSFLFHRKVYSIPSLPLSLRAIGGDRHGLIDDGTKRTDIESCGTQIILEFHILGHVPIGLLDVLGDDAGIVIGDHVDAIVGTLGCQNG
eukprot:scaffold4396_cov204-Amphora_coffeaeformis.AAC.8